MVSVSLRRPIRYNFWEYAYISNGRHSALTQLGLLARALTFFKDIRYAVRTLLKRRGFTSLAVLTLALGIGACTAIFSVVDGVLLRSLPYPEAESLVELQEVTPSGKRISFAEPNFLDVRARSRTLEGVAEYSGGTATSAALVW